MEHFQNLYATLNLDAHGAVALYDRELRLAALARAPSSSGRSWIRDEGEDKAAGKELLRDKEKATEKTR